MPVSLCNQQPVNNRPELTAAGSVPKALRSRRHHPWDRAVGFHSLAELHWWELNRSPDPGPRYCKEDDYQDLWEWGANYWRLDDWNVDRIRVGARNEYEAKTEDAAIVQPDLARQIRNQYTDRLAILKDRVLHHRKITANKSNTLWNINLNVPARSMKGILLLL